jgi:hypothetical protein
MTRTEEECTAQIDRAELLGLLGVMAPTDQQPITARTSIAQVEAELARERAVTLAEPVRITAPPPANEDWDDMPGTTVIPVPTSVARRAALLPATPRRPRRAKNQTERDPKRNEAAPVVVAQPETEREARGRLETVDEGPAPPATYREPKPAGRHAVAMLPLQPPPIDAEVAAMPLPRHVGVVAEVEPSKMSIRYAAELAAYFVIACFVGLCAVYCLA